MKTLVLGVFRLLKWVPSRRLTSEERCLCGTEVAM